MNYIKAMTNQHLKAQPECFEHRHAVFCEVGNVFMSRSWQSVAINVDAVDTNVRFTALRGSLRTDDAYLKPLIAQRQSLRPDAAVGRRGLIFYQHEYFFHVSHKLMPSPRRYIV